MKINSHTRSRGAGDWRVIFLVSIFWTNLCFAQQHDPQTAPWDYRNSEYAEDLATVNRHHFNLDVQMLRAGQSSSYVSGDLEFILRYFPNHHGALDAMARLWRRQEERSPNVPPPGLARTSSAEQYFEKALSFAPDDGIVHLIYGMHLFKKGLHEKALAHVEKAIDLNPDSPEVRYNAGLIFVAQGDYEKAMEHARFAYDAGYPLPWLRKKLISVGAWKDDT